MPDGGRIPKRGQKQGIGMGASTSVAQAHLPGAPDDPGSTGILCLHSMREPTPCHTIVTGKNYLTLFNGAALAWAGMVFVLSPVAKKTTSHPGHEEGAAPYAPCDFW